MHPVLANQYPALTAPLAFSQPPGKAGLSRMFASGRKGHEQSRPCGLDMETLRLKADVCEKAPDAFYLRPTDEGPGMSLFSGPFWRFRDKFGVPFLRRVSKQHAHFPHS